MHTRSYRAAVTLAVFFMMPSLSMAYVGPGSGITVLGALWAVIAAIFMAIAGIFIWPIRRMMQKRKISKGKETQSAEQSGQTPS